MSAWQHLLVNGSDHGRKVILVVRLDDHVGLRLDHAHLQYRDAYD